MTASNREEAEAEGMRQVRRQEHPYAQVRMDAGVSSVCRCPDPAVAPAYHEKDCPISHQAATWTA